MTPLFQKRSITPVAQPGIALPIIRELFGMLSAVDFDNEPGLDTDKKGKAPHFSLQYPEERVQPASKSKCSIRQRRPRPLPLLHASNTDVEQGYLMAVPMN